MQTEYRSYLLVDFDTNSSLSNVPDTTSTTMVELVRHTLVDGSINLHIHVITDFEGPEVGREWDNTLLPEPSREQIPGSRPHSVTRRHFRCLSFSVWWWLKPLEQTAKHKEGNL